MTAGIEQRQQFQGLACSIIDSAPDAVIVFDEVGAICEWNPQAEAIFGWKRSEVISRNVVDTIISPSFRKLHGFELTTILNRIEGSVRNRRLEVTAMRRTGNEFPAEWTISALKTANCRMFSVFLRDITERNDKTRHDSEWLRIIIDGVKDYAILTLDREGLVTSWNSGAERINGYRSDEIVGRHLSIFYDPEAVSHSVPERELAVALATGRSEDEGWRVRKDGSRFWANPVITALQSETGQLLGYSIISRDLTESRRVERLFQATFDLAPTAMVMIDDTGLIVLINSETEKLFGYSRSELLGQRVEILMPDHHRHRHVHHREVFFQDPVTRQMGAARDLFGLRRDGAEFLIEISLSPMETDEGLFVLSTIVDITERKRWEDDMRLSERRLGSANEALATSNTDLERFAYVASHDLQEPLRKISSYAQLLREECGEDLSEDAKDYLKTMINGAQRLKTLIDDLLSFSRISTRGNPLTPVDANVCLRAAIDNLEVAISESDARIACDPLPTVIADAGQLILLFQNLIGNAIKYRGEAVPTVHVGARDLGDQCEVFVQDNGIGIAPQFFERVFEIFQRLHNRREYSGTGIGLSICKRIVERFGGNIWLQSTLGSGSTFYFTINNAHLQKDQHVAIQGT